MLAPSAGAEIANAGRCQRFDASVRVHAVVHSRGDVDDGLGLGHGERQRAGQHPAVEPLVPTGRRAGELARLVGSAVVPPLPPSCRCRPSRPVPSAVVSIPATVPRSSWAIFELLWSQSPTHEQLSGRAVPRGRAYRTRRAPSRTRPAPDRCRWSIRTSRSTRSRTGPPAAVGTRTRSTTRSSLPVTTTTTQPGQPTPTTDPTKGPPVPAVVLSLSFNPAPRASVPAPIEHHPHPPTTGGVTPTTETVTPTSSVVPPPVRSGSQPAASSPEVGLAQGPSPIGAPQGGAQEEGAAHHAQEEAGEGAGGPQGRAAGAGRSSRPARRRPGRRRRRRAQRAPANSRSCRRRS